MVIMLVGIGFAYVYPHYTPLIWRIPYTQFDIHPKTDSQATKAIQDLRRQCQTRFRIISSYRSTEKNTKVDGTKDSQHLKGLAFDVVVPMSMREDFYSCAKKATFRGFGWGNNTVHIDKGSQRWWTYDDNGHHVSGKEKFKYLHKAPASFRKDIDAQ